MLWRVYDRTDTLLDSVESDIDYIDTDNNFIKLSNNEEYNIKCAYTDGTEGYIYVDKLILN